ncbi:MAG: DEAD/DEAH box helicase, partial [Pseudomonadota bacterium]|nr:DEAD/DEAH box helicase [Pseudomonadota bacterium]
MTQSNDDLRFEDLGLSQPVLQALDLKGYNNPTPIQAQAIPPVLEGRDLMGIAQTGTGKTAAFMLPSIDRLREADKQTPFKSCRMLVLAPTRELAGQIAQNAKDYGALAGLKVHSIVGGTSVNKDRNKLHRGTDILVATPGRLLDLIDQKAFTLDKVEVLVLDEADQMLDLGFIHALRRISQLVPEDRQTLFFSATMPKQIQELVGKYCHNPVKVSVTPESTTAERIDQFLFMVQQDEKQTLLEMILSERHPVPGKFERVLIFARTKHGCDRIVKKLSQSGIPANAIHGNKSQPQRERALGEFRSAKTPILVATDVAARGIDIPGVSHVLNYELPNVPEQYVHRIGRTARAGRDGIAIAFCAEDERDYLKDIRKKTVAEFERLALPDNFRAVVEGVGPTKREQKPRLVRPKVRPAGDAARKPKPKQKHTARKGKPAGA